MKKILNGDRIALGTCYYPEHWPKEMWKNDLERMSSVGIEVVRIAEFAWSKFERTEGDFTFDFLFSSAFAQMGKLSTNDNTNIKLITLFIKSPTNIYYNYLVLITIFWYNYLN